MKFLLLLLLPLVLLGCVTAPKKSAEKGSPWEPYPNSGTYSKKGEYIPSAEDVAWLRRQEERCARTGELLPGLGEEPSPDYVADYSSPSFNSSYEPTRYERKPIPYMEYEPRYSNSNSIQQQQAARTASLRKSINSIDTSKRESFTKYRSDPPYLTGTQNGNTVRLSDGTTITRDRDNYYQSNGYGSSKLRGSALNNSVQFDDGSSVSRIGNHYFRDPGPSTSKSRNPTLYGQ